MIHYSKNNKFTDPLLHRSITKLLEFNKIIRYPKSHWAGKIKIATAKSCEESHLPFDIEDLYILNNLFYYNYNKINRASIIANPKYYTPVDRDKFPYFEIIKKLLFMQPSSLPRTKST